MARTQHAVADWTLLFLHIPKTAGSSIRRALEPLYDPAERLYLYERASLKGAVHPNEFKDLPESDRARPRFIMGHFRYGIHQHVPRPARYATIVRDAIDRVVSHYGHYRSLASPREGTRASAEHALIGGGGLSLDDWVFGLQRVEADNWMTRVISGRYGIPFGACPDDMLREALEHIDEHFESVLAVERMDAGARWLSSSLGARIPAMTVENRNPDRPALETIDRASLDRIIDLNRLDLQLHQHVLRQLDGRERRGG